MSLPQLELELEINLPTTQDAPNHPPLKMKATFVGPQAFILNLEDLFTLRDTISKWEISEERPKTQSDYSALVKKTIESLEAPNLAESTIISKTSVAFDSPTRNPNFNNSGIRAQSC